MMEAYCHWSFRKKLFLNSSESKSLPEDEGGTSEEQFFQPEPYQQEASSENSPENFSEKSENLNVLKNKVKAPKIKFPSESLNSDLPPSTLDMATDRMDDGEGTKQVDNTS